MTNAINDLTLYASDRPSVSLGRFALAGHGIAGFPRVASSAADFQRWCALTEDHSDLPPYPWWLQIDVTSVCAPGTTLEGDLMAVDDCALGKEVFAELGRVVFMAHGHMILGVEFEVDRASGKQVVGADVIQKIIPFLLSP